MSESLVDLRATDAQLDLLGGRGYDATADVVLNSLAVLAAAVDEAPLPPFPLPGQVCAAGRSKVRNGGWALAVALGLMVTTSGVAAAVSDSPLGPLHYVSNQMWRLGPHDHHRIPGLTLSGSMPISTVRGAAAESSGPGLSNGVATSRVARGDNAALGRAGGHPAGGAGGGGGDGGGGGGAGSAPGGGSSGGSGGSGGREPTAGDGGTGGGTPPVVRPPGDNGGDTNPTPGPRVPVRGAGPGDPSLPQPPEASPGNAGFGSGSWQCGADSLVRPAGNSDGHHRDSCEHASVPHDPGIRSGTPAGPPDLPPPTTPSAAGIPDASSPDALGLAADASIAQGPGSDDHPQVEGLSQSKD